jgi:hypothetical protein
VKLLIEALSAGPQISSYCTRLEPREHELIAYPNEAGLEGLSTLLTAITAAVGTRKREAAGAGNDRGGAGGQGRRFVIWIERGLIVREADFADWQEALRNAGI